MQTHIRGLTTCFGSLNIKTRSKQYWTSVLPFVAVIKLVRSDCPFILLLTAFSRRRNLVSCKESLVGRREVGLLLGCEMAVLVLRS